MVPCSLCKGSGATRSWEDLASACPVPSVPLPQATMICSSCQSLCESIDPRRDKEIILHGDVKSLRSSSDSGCHLCKIIFSVNKERLDSDKDTTSVVLIKVKSDIALEVSFPDGSPKQEGCFSQANQPLPVTWVLLQELSLPGMYMCTTQPLLANL